MTDVARAGRSPMPTAGYTLIEMMVVVAIVAVLALTALPSYRSHVLRTHRALARVTLVDLAAKMEVERLQRGRYPASLDFHLAGRSGAVPGASRFTIITGGDVRTVRTSVGLYEIRLETSPASTTPDAFRLTATAINAQAGDRSCLVLSVDSTGRRLPVAGKGGAADCWIR